MYSRTKEQINLETKLPIGRHRQTTTPRARTTKMGRKKRQQKTTHSPIEYGWLLFLDVVGGDVTSLVAVVHDPPPVL